MTQALRRQICGKWRKSPDGLRLVCRLSWGHHLRRNAGPHESARSPWKWWGRKGPWVRDWTCRGLVDAGLGERCGKTAENVTEDAARVKGWRIGRQPDGQPDPLCPACGRPDPNVVANCRALEASIRRTTR